jgi:Fe-S cluster assembly ATP-binding protein
LNLLKESDFNIRRTYAFRLKGLRKREFESFALKWGGVIHPIYNQGFGFFLRKSSIVYNANYQRIEINMIAEQSEVILAVRDLRAEVEGIEILKGVNLEVKAGEIHGIMGLNGSGKSTFSKVLTGHPDYTVTGGEVWFRGQNLLELAPEERALSGMFLAFQYPLEIPGVTNADFLRLAYNTLQKHIGKPELDLIDFDDLIQEKLKVVEMNSSFLSRSVNEGFSGGEKKRNEILQMAILEPTLAILDETDSGLDIDALKIVAAGVNQLANADNCTIVITHYQRLLNYIVPDFIHVMDGGRIIRTGDKNLAMILEEQGYDWLLGDRANQESTILESASSANKGVTA